MRYWLPLVAWVVLIFIGSGDVLSPEHTSRFIEPFLTWLWPNISTATLEQIHFSFRKAAHMVEYAILALLLCRAMAHTGKSGRSKLTLLVGVWIGCVVVAAADEFRQSFVESRGPSPWDVMIDAAGAAFALLIFSRWIKNRSGASV